MVTGVVRKAVLAVVSLAFVHECSKADSIDLQVTVGQVGRDPLPYQGVRLQVTLQNRGTRVTDRLALLETGFALVRSKGRTSSSDWIPGGRLAPSDRPGFESKSGIALAILGERQKLALRPGDKELVTFPVSHVPYGRDVAMFPEPGKYPLRVRYLARSREPILELTSEPVTVSVAKPEGVDAVIHQMLVDDAKLALLMNPFSFRFTPLDAEHAAAVPSLERIILRYPKSSYADYARFALAKAYLQGPHGKGPMAPEDAKVAAAALLESINVKEWAYGPAALILLKSITTDPKKAEKIKETLDKDFPDSIEWLAEQAEMMELREDQTYPPRGPRRAKP